MEEDKLEKIVNAILKASERMESVINKELGPRLEDLDMSITFMESKGRKDVVFELNVSGFRAKKSYEMIVEEALKEGEEEIDRAFRENEGVNRGDKE